MNSLYWLLQEPLIFGSCLALTSELRHSVTEENLLNSGILTIGQILQVAGANFYWITYWGLSIQIVPILSLIYI